jgi:hypothetical protein
MIRIPTDLRISAGKEARITQKSHELLEMALEGDKSAYFRAAGMKTSEPAAIELSMMSPTLKVASSAGAFTKQ